MKRIFTLIFIISAVSANLKAQTLLEDDFNYSGELTANGWNVTLTNVNDPIMTTTGLTFTGYPGSGVGNAALVNGANEDVNRGFAAQSGQDNEVWMSALVNVTDTAATTGGYFLHLGDRNDTAASKFTEFAARLFAKTNADGGVTFGISNTATAVYGTTTFSTNTTYFIVVKYVFDTSDNATVRLWVISSGVPADQASLGTPEVSTTGSTIGFSTIDAVGIRQSAGIPDVILDGLRIATKYVDVVTLPLNLVSFKAFLSGDAVKLSWTSTSESNVKDYTVERSKDGRIYLPIGSVAALNRNEAVYSFSDAAPLADENYYRLKMTDKDGTFRYSKVAFINNRNGIKAQVFPNPVINSVTVAHTRATTGATLKIVSVQGQQLKLYLVEPGATQTSITVGELKNGTYMLIYQNGSERSVTRFVK